MSDGAQGPTFGFSADRPIASRGEDLLGRADFAEKLADALCSWRGRDSLVVALYGPHRQEGVLNVNVVDLVGMECLRVFEPEVFRGLPGRKVVLTDLGQSVDGKEKRESIESLLSLVNDGRREQVREILKCIFEPVKWVLNNYGYGHGFEERWIRTRRASASGMFDRYFQLSLSRQEISEAEVERFLASTDIASDSWICFEMRVAAASLRRCFLGWSRTRRNSISHTPQRS